MTHLEQEKKTVRQMVEIYCYREKHSSSKGLCEECSALLDYACQRLNSCSFGEQKPTCKKCPVHCYKPEMREKIRQVMRYRRSAYDLVSSPHSNQTPASRNQFLDEVVKLQAKLYSCAGPDISTTPWNRRFQILKLPERRSKLAAGSLARHHFIGFFFTFGFGSAGIVALTRLARYSLSSTSLM